MMPNMTVMQCPERMEQVPVATAGTGAEGFRRRRHPQMPAAIAADKADDTQHPQQTAVHGEQGGNRQDHDQHCGEDFDNHHTQSPSLNLWYRDSIVIRCSLQVPSGSGLGKKEH
jgi:hypothetical protein